MSVLLCFVVGIQKINFILIWKVVSISLINPLQSSFLWNTQGLLMNYPFMLTLFVIVNLILRYHKNNTNHGTS